MKLALVFLSVAASALADGAHSPAKRFHHAHVAENLAHRSESQNLTKRESFSGTATWYDVTPNAGACGQWMTPDQFVVALNSPQLNAYGGYQGGRPTSCDRWITIQANGGTQQAIIKDECPTCGWGSLDLSESLFRSFADLGAGVFPITWWFNDGDNSGNSGGGGGGGNNNNGGDQHQQTSETQPAWTPPPEPTPSSTSETSTSTSSTPTTTESPSPSPTNDSENVNAQNVPEPTENWNRANQAVVQVAAFIHAAAAANH